jgi:2-aminoethylphosphonate transport system ATP-binding protein
MSAVAFATTDVSDTGAAADRRAGSNVSFDNVSVSYRGNVVLKPLTLEVAAGEILALIGPSGSGKTTALRAVAGFVKPAGGRIRIGAADVTDLPPYERGLGMVVQNYALFPHMRADDNVAFGLRAQRADKKLIDERVREALRVVGMSSYAKRYPRELSGGQQQRVAIARALAVRPRVLLLDEPLSALDAQIRRNMVEEIARLHRELPGLTILYVTHDQTEALTLADKIAIMRDGKVSAHGPTAELYRRPPNRFTAEFLGRANLVPVTVMEAPASNGFARVLLGENMLTAAGRDEKAGDHSLLCIRPQHLSLTADGGHTNSVTGTLKEVHWQGELTHLVLDVRGAEVRMSATRLPIALPETGSKTTLYFTPGDSSLVAEDIRG